MLELHDLAIRIVLSVSLLLLHQCGRTISISVVTDENATTSRARPTNIAQSRLFTDNTTNEFLEAANSTIPHRRVTVLSRKFKKMKPASVTDYSSQLSSQPVSTHRHSNFSFGESSSTTSNEAYVRIGANHSAGNSNIHETTESGFKPFEPSPAIDVLAPKFDLKDAYVNEFDGKSLKWGWPPNMKHSQAVSDSNDYPTYSDVPSRGSFDASYSKYFDEDYGFLSTTSDPTKISFTRTNVYGDEHRQSALSIHSSKSKRKPYTGYLYGNSWKNGAYTPPDQNFFDGFTNQEDHSLDVNGYDASKAAYVRNKLQLKKSLLHILTTLIPFGLLLSAIPPKVVIINSTNSTRPESIHQKAYIRNLGQEFLRLNNVSVNDTLDNAIRIEDLKTSDLSCTKLRICEAALGLRRTIVPSSSLEDYSLWHILSRSSNSVGVDSNLQEILEAVAQKQCSKFACEKPSPSAQSPTE